MTRDHSFRKTLRRTYESRAAKNTSYSLRAYARDLELSPGAISQLLHGKMGLSEKRAKGIARRLALSESETAIFIASATSEHGRSRTARQAAREKLEQLDAPGTVLSVDAFQVVSDWYHFAILELLGIEPKLKEPAHIAERLGIPAKVAQYALDRLLSLELLEALPQGGWRATGRETLMVGGVPSEAVRKAHAQLLEKASAALETQSIDRRSFSSTLFSVNRRDLPRLMQRLKEIRLELTREFSAVPEKDAVYCLGIQLFDLTQEKKQ